MLRAGWKLEGAVPITNPATLEPEKDTGWQEGQDSAGPGQKEGTHRVASWMHCGFQVKVWRRASGPQANRMSPLRLSHLIC